MLIELENLKYKYKDSSPFTFGPVNLTLHTDSITAIIGSNGSGKSTLIKLLIKELIEYTGKYLINSVDETNLTGDFMRKHGIGYLPEVPLLDDELSAYEIISLIKGIRQVSDEQFKQEIEFYKCSLGIDDWFYSQPCKDYSLGMRKKTAIICALLGPLNFAILDEPTNGLDPLAVYGLKQIIKQKHESGTGILVTSHMLDFIEKIVHNVIFLRKGTIVHHDSIDGITDKRGNAISLDEFYFSLHRKKESAYE